jgi:HEAT repeat protein
VSPTEDPAVARAAELAGDGLAGPLTAAQVDRATAALRDDLDARVRAAALGALVRGATPDVAMTAWCSVATDPNETVRRRVADLGPAVTARDPMLEPEVAVAVVALLADTDVTVVVAAAGALGELAAAAVEAGAVPALAGVATDHDDALAREAAVASLGALGDPDGLPAILTACDDKPPVRRRAVLALAPFAGPAVDAALQAAATDRDWQVRQAAEDLSR